MRWSVVINDKVVNVSLSTIIVIACYIVALAVQFSRCCYISILEQIKYSKFVHLYLKKIGKEIPGWTYWAKERQDAIWKTNYEDPDLQAMVLGLRELMIANRRNAFIIGTMTIIVFIAVLLLFVSGVIQ